MGYHDVACPMCNGGLDEDPACPLCWGDGKLDGRIVAEWKKANKKEEQETR
jgi:hypothetical protein